MLRLVWCAGRRVPKGGRGGLGPQHGPVWYLQVIEDLDVLSQNKCPWSGGCEGRCPYLVHGISLLSWGCQQHRDSTFPTWSQYAILPAPLLVALISWQYFLFLEMISSGEKSGLVWLPLSGSCCPCWAWRPSIHPDRTQGKTSGKVLAPEAGLIWLRKCSFINMPIAASPSPSTMPCLWYSLFHLSLLF